MSTTATRTRKPFTAAERAEYKESKQAEALEILDGVVAMFETGDLPEAIAQTMILRADGSTPIAHWSLSNQLLAIKQGTTDARGYRQWGEVGRQVKKGCRAIRILGPVLVKKEEERNGETSERKILVGYRPIPVFRLQDTEGEPVAEIEPPELPPLFDVAGRMGVRVDYLPSHQLATFRGCYYPGRGEITLLTHDARTWFHELAHAAHDRVTGGKGDFGGMKEAELETVAETVAATLCKLYGQDGFLFHGAKYVERWSGGNAGKAAVKVLGDIQKTLCLILDLEGKVSDAS